MTNHLGDALLVRYEKSKAPLLLLPNRNPLSYQEFFRWTGQLANVLTACGLYPGDRVLAQMHKTVAALALYGASLRSGVVLIPASPTYDANQLSEVAKEYGAKLVVCDDRFVGALSVSCPVLTLNADASGDLARQASRLDSRFPDVERADDDLAIVMLTSGTTSQPKACMLTHDNLLSNARALVDAWAMTADDVVFHALPIYHTHGLLISTNAVLLAGAAMWFLPGPSVPGTLPQLARSTVVMGTPKFYDDLLVAEDFTKAMATSVRVFISGGACLNSATLDEFETRTSHRILERHGMTEANVSASNPYRGERRAGSVGPALPGISIRVSDPENGKELPTGSVGSVEIRGPNVFRGYLNNEGKTREVFRPDGYFITGDVGRMQPDGYLEILARSEDLVWCGGERIDPREIEVAIDRIPGILESAVIGVPDLRGGELLVAIAVRRRGAAVSEEALLRALEDRLSRDRVPAAVCFIDELPRTATGKIQKRHLRAMFATNIAGAINLVAESEMI
jgi:malonyl-CoA/methylmalonyl-CoA synthetase